MSSVTLPNKLTKIANNLFLECESLTSITIPESVESIEYSVFARSGLTSITIPDGVKSIGNSAFVYCYDLTSVTLPNSLIEVNNNLFSWCSGLTSMTIPNNVTSIGGWAFSDCTNLTSVTIGRRVTTINQDAFKNCESLTDIFCLAKSVPEIPWEIFDEGRQQDITAHVPASSIEAYRADSHWGKFKEIVALEETVTASGDANGDGTLNAADIVEIVNVIMGHPSVVFDKDAADLNGDGVINAADVIELVSIIMTEK